MVGACGGLSADKLNIACLMTCKVAQHIFKDLAHDREDQQSVTVNRSAHKLLVVAQPGLVPQNAQDTKYTLHKRHR